MQKRFELLYEGGKVFGTAVLSTSPHWVPAIRSVGLDFVFIDTEHTPIDRLTAAWMIQAYEASGLATLVRIPRPDPYLVRETLDAGASGVVAPYVEDAETVRLLAAAVRYRPLKGSLLKEKELLSNVTTAYLERYNKNRILIVNIESRPALDCLTEILSQHDLDGVLIGPHDLSVSLGCPEDYKHPEFCRAVKQIISISRNHGKAVGVHAWLSLAIEQEWMREGANIILHSSDLYAARSNLAAEIRILRAAAESKRPADDPVLL